MDYLKENSNHCIDELDQLSFKFAAEENTRKRKAKQINGNDKVRKTEETASSSDSSEIDSESELSESSSESSFYDSDSKTDEF